MEKRTQKFIELAKDLVVSVVEHSPTHKEIAVLWKNFFGEWEIDDLLKDVIHVETDMEVYGTIEHVIKPAYAEYL